MPDDPMKTIRAAHQSLGALLAHHDGPPAPLVIPRAEESEDGGVYWIDGHVDPALALLSVVLTTMVDVGADEAMDALVAPNHFYAADGFNRYQQQLERANESLNNVRHIWLKEDPNNEELMLPTTAHDPDARPFTTLDLN